MYIVWVFSAYHSSCFGWLFRGSVTSLFYDKVLHCLATDHELLKYFAGSSVILPYTDLPGMRASDCPQATIPPSPLITSYRQDLVIYNKGSNSIFMLELTCPLDSTCHLQAARDRMQGKTEYLEIVSEFQCVEVACSYDTLELSVLEHYLPSSLTSLKIVLIVFWVKRHFLNLTVDKYFNWLLLFHLLFEKNSFS